MNTIRIVTGGKNNEALEWKDSEERQYTWSVGMAGELIVYFAIMHTVISNAEVESGIQIVYAAGTWANVENVPE